MSFNKLSYHKGDALTLPKGWEIKYLGEVCEKISRGISPKYVEKKGVIVLNQKCIRDHKINFQPSRKHDEVNKGVNDDKYIRIGDVLVNSTGEGTLGRVAQVRDLPNERVTVDSHISIVRPLKDKFFLDFFGWAMIFIENEIENSGAGASGQTELARTVLENNFKIAFPQSLPEQQRIVSILDECFSAIERSRNNAEQNLKNAKELFESYLQGVFENKGEGWEEYRFEDLCDLITCGVASTPKYVDESAGVPFLSAQNVRDGEVVLDKYRYISKQFHQELTKKNKPSKGDILYSRVGSKFGEAGVVEHDFEFSVYVSLTLIKPKPNKLNNYYLKYYLNSPLIKAIAKKSISSSGVPNLNVKEVREFPIKCPSILIQNKIVNEIEMVSTETKRLEAIYQKKIDDLEELKKSILQKAFSGGLN